MFSFETIKAARMFFARIENPRPIAQAFRPEAFHNTSKMFSFQPIKAARMFFAPDRRSSPLNGVSYSRHLPV